MCIFENFEIFKSFLTKISHGCDVYFTEIISSVISTLSECVSVYFVYTVQCFEVIFYKTLRIHKNTNIVVFYLMFCHFSIHIALFFEPADTPEVAIHPSLSDFFMFLIHIHRWERKTCTLDISCFTADDR